MIEVITHPSDLPLSVEELKDHLRVSDDYEGPVIEHAIRSATRRVERDLGLFPMRQTIRVTVPIDRNRARLPINRSNHIEAIDAVVARDRDGGETPVDPGDVVLLRGGPVLMLRPRSTTSWPHRTIEASVDLVVGHEAPGGVPADVRLLVTAFASWLFETRVPDDSTDAIEKAWRWLSSGLRNRYPV